MLINLYVKGISAQGPIAIDRTTDVSRMSKSYSPEYILSQIPNVHIKKKPAKDEAVKLLIYWLSSREAVLQISVVPV